MEEGSRNEVKIDDGLDGLNDVYGVGSNPMEVDSDVNEDANREELLDDAMQHFGESIRHRIKVKEWLTSVPDDSAFEGESHDGSK